MTVAHIVIINGPNLNMLGQRENDIYGTKKLEEINSELIAFAANQEATLEFFQSNHEGALVDFIQQIRDRADGMIINPGALTHYGISLYDALKSFSGPIIEVHISNIFAREEFRHKSLISPLARGGIFGLGSLGYKMALEAVLSFTIKKS